MNDRYGWRFLAWMGGVLLLLMWFGVSPNLPLLRAAPACEYEKSIRLHTGESILERTRVACLEITIPARTAEVILEYTPGSSEYEIYWDDQFQKSERGSPTATYSYQAEIQNYQSVTEDRRHVIKFVPVLPESSLPSVLTVYAKTRTGERQTTVGETSGSGNRVGIPGPPGDKFIVERVYPTIPARSRFSSTFVARCGLISLIADWPENAATYDNFQLILYDPRGQQVHQVPVGPALGPHFSFNYPISPYQVSESDRWTAEFVNGSQRPVAMEGSMTSYAECETVDPVRPLLLFEENFSSNAAEWEVGALSNDSLDREWRLANGQLRLAMTSKSNTWSANSLPNFTAQDFLLTFDAQIIQAAGDFSGGQPAIRVAFRINNDSFYRVFFTDGAYRVDLAASGSEQRLVDWTRNPAIRLEPGAPTSFTLIVKNSTIALAVEGQEIVKLTDSGVIQPAVFL